VDHATNLLKLGQNLNSAGIDGWFLLVGVFGAKRQHVHICQVTMATMDFVTLRAVNDHLIVAVELLIRLKELFSDGLVLLVQVFLVIFITVFLVFPILLLLN